MAPVLRNPSKKKLGRPKVRKTKKCWRCHITLSTPYKLIQHLKRKTGCGPKAVARQVEKRRAASRLSTKIYSIKKELDKVGWDEYDEFEVDDEETKNNDEDETMEGGEHGHRYVWVTDSDNLRRSKDLATVDWEEIIDLR
ncbi:hypothetical protein PPTG_11109 [Phytophthora nicotianae INRA-310]|uniref:Uncharacterized protein n=1 Tax=Phytophthora nicotianae (strain INRA-310) TaxID=761204 RepID=W2Q784_PHYN3|nr:hypothetical protein PPTG_11109 [Phytophthora nicotianae INRA-310]ETN09053.1 hypothetical protein PPTG_11109 [Phytophthora nicotianae INRA-310]